METNEDELQKQNQFRAALMLASRNIGILKGLIENPYDIYDRQRLSDMLFDFLRDADKEGMTQDKANWAEISCFINDWLKKQFPFTFHDPNCPACKEINERDSENPQGYPAPIKPFLDLNEPDTE